MSIRAATWRADARYVYTPTDMKDFRDKLAVITGAGTGMGRELARQLASEGCHLAVCDVPGQAVRTQNEDVSGVRGQLDEVRLDRAAHTDGPRQHVSAGVVTRGDRRDLASP